jgi:hypothetical protein
MNKIIYFDHHKYIDNEPSTSSSYWKHRDTVMSIFLKKFNLNLIGYQLERPSYMAFRPLDENLFNLLLLTYSEYIVTIEDEIAPL